MPKTGETMIAHLQGREKLLEYIGFPRQQAEWITLVCLHSGLFTRDQLAFTYTGPTASTSGDGSKPCSIAGSRPGRSPTNES